MDVLSTLGVALGLASLAGINLYLTVFVSGLAIHMHWVKLSPAYGELAVLGDPIIVGVAGFLFLVEFFADKVPWVDTAWDAVHTFIRPVGAAALAVAALGELHPIFSVIAALLAGGMALTTHTAKAGTRLVANTSPEPVTNVGLSLAEDGLVLGGLGLIAWNPVVALVVAALATATILFFLPKLVRGIRSKLWLAWCKLNARPGQPPAELRQHLPSSLLTVLRRAHAGDSAIAWSVPCLSGGGPRLPSNLSGWLVALEGEPDVLFFVARKWLGSLLLEIDVRGASVTHQAGFLANRLDLAHREGRPRHTFLFDHSRGDLPAEIARRLAPESALAA